MTNELIARSDDFAVRIESVEPKPDDRFSPDTKWNLVVEHVPHQDPAVTSFDDGEKRISVEDDVAGWILRYLPEEDTA